MADMFAKRQYSASEWYDYLRQQNDAVKAENQVESPLEYSAGISRPLAVERKGLAVREQALMAKILSMDPEDPLRADYVRAYHQLRTYQEHGMGTSPLTTEPETQVVRNKLYSLYTDAARSPTAALPYFANLQAFAFNRADTTSHVSVLDKLGLGNLLFPTLPKVGELMLERVYGPSDPEASSSPVPLPMNSVFADVKATIPFALSRSKVREELSSGKIDADQAQKQLDAITADEKASAAQRYKKNSKNGQGPTTPQEDSALYRQYAAILANPSLANKSLPTSERELAVLAKQEVPKGKSWMGEVKEVEGPAGDDKYFKALDNFVVDVAHGQSVFNPVIRKAYRTWLGLRHLLLGSHDDQLAMETVALSLAPEDTISDVVKGKLPFILQQNEVAASLLGVSAPSPNPATPKLPTLDPLDEEVFADMNKDSAMKIYAQLLHERAIIDNHHRTPTATLSLPEQANRAELATVIAPSAASGVYDTLLAQSFARNMMTECVERGTVGFGVQAIVREKANPDTVHEYVAKHKDTLTDSVYTRCKAALKRANVDGSVAPVRAVSSSSGTIDTDAVITPAYARVMADTLPLIDSSIKIAAPEDDETTPTSSSSSSSSSYLDRTFTRDTASKIVDSAIQNQLTIGAKETKLFRHVSILATNLIAFANGFTANSKSQSPLHALFSSKVPREAVAEVRNYTSAQIDAVESPFGPTQSPNDASRFMWFSGNLDAPTIFARELTKARQDPRIADVITPLAYSAMARRVGALSASKTLFDAPKTNEDVMKVAPQ